MNQFEEPYLRMREEYAGRMPFYLTYPMTNVYQTEKEYERDMELMKELYPRETRQILEVVEEECDKMEYEGSMMFDEYPDKLQLRMMCRRIYDKAEKEEENPGEWLNELIQVMAFQELCQRRCEHRHYRKKLY